jgi:hypothetical protein
MSIFFILLLFRKFLSTSISFCHTVTSTGEGVLVYGSLDLIFQH